LLLEVHTGLARRDALLGLWQQALSGGERLQSRLHWQQ